MIFNKKVRFIWKFVKKTTPVVWGCFEKIVKFVAPRGIEPRLQE